MTHFTETELKALDELFYDDKALPYFDPLRDCLRWLDEVPPTASGSAYEHVIDLAIVRGFIHLGRKREEWYALSPTTYFSEVWDEALKGAPNWPGFRRLSLSESENAYLDQERSKPLEEHIS